jgi:hypothetical protein
MSATNLGKECYVGDPRYAAETCDCFKVKPPSVGERFTHDNLGVEEKKRGNGEDGEVCYICRRCRMVYKKKVT